MNLFKRYQIILVAVFLVVMVISTSLVGLQWRTAYLHEMSIISETFAESASDLDRIIKATTDHLHILRTTAQDDLLFSHLDESDSFPAPLRDQLRVTTAADGEYRYVLEPGTNQHRADMGKLQGLGTLKQFEQDGAAERELNMALRLNATLKSTLQNLPEAAWAYYLSARQFINLYPYDSTFDLDSSVLNLALFTGGQPENNPQRQPFWTQPYLDLAGQGLMVTASAPVDEAQQFRGIVGIDLTLNLLNEVIRDFSYPHGTLMVIGEQKQLLGHPQLINLDDETIKPLSMALPENLDSQIESLLFSADPQQSNSDLQTGPDSQQVGQQQTITGWWLVLDQEIKGTPWYLLCVIPKTAIYWSIASNGLLISFIPLLGLGGCLLVTSRLLETIFIQPACQLVEQITQVDQENGSVVPSDIPEAWLPSFQAVADSFNDNRMMMSEQKIQLQYLQSTQLQLVQSEKMSALGNLVSGVAHEINNPLGFVKGNLKELELNMADLLEHLSLYQDHAPVSEIAQHAEAVDLDYLLEDIPKMLTSMEKGCDRMKDISTSLRTFSRADQATKALFNLHEGLESTLLLLKHRLKANDQRLAIHVETLYGDIPVIECFPGQLNQVFMNILANAIDVFDEAAQTSTLAVLPEHPQIITIETTEWSEENCVAVYIRDNGQGMSQEVTDRVFDHLFTTKVVGKGTGLGLAIAHQIITETHGGTITVKSELGHGTEFCVKLPLSEASPDPSV